MGASTATIESAAPLSAHVAAGTGRPWATLWQVTPNEENKDHACVEWRPFISVSQCTAPLTPRTHSQHSAPRRCTTVATTTKEHPPEAPRTPNCIQTHNAPHTVHKGKGHNISTNTHSTRADTMQHTARDAMRREGTSEAAPGAVR